MRLGFIGLGKMGRPMAQNLLRAGFALTVHNRSRTVVDELVALGATGASSPGEVAQQTDVVMTCLPDSAAVEQVYLETHGLVEAARPSQVFVDHSTIAPKTSRHLANVLYGKRAIFLDAPVSGGTAGAKGGTLTIMVGGDPKSLERVRPVLEAMGQKIHHVGPSGAGSVIKLANQLLVAINMAGVVEALVLAVKAGADAQIMLDVLESSFGGSAMLKRAVPLILKGDFAPGTPIKLILKDLGLISDLADDLTVRLLLGTIVQEVFREAYAQGLGEQDMVALVKPLSKLVHVSFESEHQSS